MDPARALTQEAAWAARSVQGDNKPDLTAEARMRMMAYRSQLDRHRFQCPKCWVRNGMKSPLASVSGTNDYDVLRCHGCGSDFVIPFEG